MFGGLFKGLAKATGIGLLVNELFIKPQEEALAAQERAQEQARADAAKAADQADQATNKANRKAPDLSALLAGNAMTKGVGSTMLTGPGGVGTSNLTLGRNQLLGS